MTKGHSIDRSLFIITIFLVAFGYLIFSSASLGLLVKENSSFGAITLKQGIIGIIGGGIALFVMSRINFKFWKKSAFYIFIGAIVVNLLVFIPGLSIEHGGAARWLSLGPFSFQPSELLKLAGVLYYAAWLSSFKNKIDTFSYGLLPLITVCTIISSVLLLQHDTDPIIIGALIAMFFVAGGKITHISMIILTGLIALSCLVFLRPYILERLLTFTDPSRDSLGTGYQIQQSLIAIGTGGIMGRGFGQSIQKFNFLPEPIGDSIFAVAAEEFGFIGASILVILFLSFALRSIRIATDQKDLFGSSVVVGFTILLIGQSFLNMGAMLGVLPLTGVPLIFVSQGGTAMLVGLIQVGIILNISRYKKQ
jgi:cell division protein FtsW